MFKKVLLVLIGISLFSCKITQNTDWEKSGLNGNIKSITIYNKDSIVSIIKEFNEIGFLTKMTLFNPKIEMTYYYEDDLLKQVKGIFKNDYEYNINKYSYDKKGRKIELLSGENYSKTEYFYDKKNRIIKSKVYHINKSPFYITYEYEKDIKREYNKQLTLKKSYILKKEKYLIQFKYSGNGKIITEYKYNDNGDMKSMTYFNPKSNSIDYATSYEYSAYDQYNNWTVNESINYNGKHFTTRREIEYY